MSKRISQLDGLRACAILAVFLHHAFGVRMLWMGVDVFFVLSGFLITGILLDMKHGRFKEFIGQFYARRVRRILPPYFLYLLLTTIFLGTAWTKHWYLYFGLTNYTFLFRDGYVPGMDILWSLGVEEQFYLVWPLLVFFVRDKRLPIVLLGLLVAAPTIRGLATILGHNHLSLHELHWLVYFSTPMRMDCMAMGALLTFVWRRYSEQVRAYGYLALGFTIVTPLLMIVLSHHQGWSTTEGTLRGNVVTYEISLFAATGVFLWALGGRFVGILTNSAMTYLGKISYSFYLVHASTILLVHRYVHQPFAAAGVAFVMSLGYASLSWHFLELPILHGGQKRVVRAELAAAEPLDKAAYSKPIPHDGVA